MSFKRPLRPARQVASTTEYGSVYKGDAGTTIDEMVNSGSNLEEDPES